MLQNKVFLNVKSRSHLQGDFEYTNSFLSKWKVYSFLEGLILEKSKTVEHGLSPDQVQAQVEGVNQLCISQAFGNLHTLKQVLGYGIESKYVHTASHNKKDFIAKRSEFLIEEELPPKDEFYHPPNDSSKIKKFQCTCPSREQQIILRYHSKINFPIVLNFENNTDTDTDTSNKSQSYSDVSNDTSFNIESSSNGDKCSIQCILKFGHVIKKTRTIKGSGRIVLCNYLHGIKLFCNGKDLFFFCLEISSTYCIIKPNIL